MRNDLTDITLVVDRSGSMESCRDDAEGGINSFIKEQKEVEGEANLTLVQFDNEYEFVYNGVPIKDVGKYSLVPRNMTALLDAVGKAINETGERLSKMEEQDRPGCVIFVIVTDGHENSSKEFNKQQVKEMIERQQSQYNWQFTFLGADATSFDEAKSLGVCVNNIAIYNKTNKSGMAYNVASSKVSNMRCANLAGKTSDLSYSDEERSSMS